MTNHGKNNSSSPLSQTFQNESFYLNFPNNILNNVGGGFSLPSYQIPIHNNNQIQAQGQAADPEPMPRGRPQIQAQAQVQADSKPGPRGRPLGSKNNPKLDLPITKKELEKNIQMMVFHFAPGIDVVGHLMNLADKYNARIHVMSARGKIASATVLDLSRRRRPDPNVVSPYAAAPTKTLQGPLTLVELSGCYIGCFPNNIGYAADSYSLNALLNDDHTTLRQLNKESFRIAFLGARPGETISEIVGGKIVAGSTGVMVTFTMISNKNVMYYKVKPDNAGGVGGASYGVGAGAGAGADVGGASGSGGKNYNMAES